MGRIAIASSPARPPAAPFRLAELPWGRIAVGCALAAAATAFLFSRIDVHELHRTAARMPAVPAFALLAVLPLIGFPASVLHVAAGIRFGAPLGLALVAASIAFQLVASHFIVQRWRDRFERASWIRKVRRRLPQGTHSSICVFAVLLPGAPYAAINYALPLIGVRLRTFLLCCFPIHVLRSSITVVLGDQSDRLTPARLAVLAGYALLIAGASWWMYRRVKRQFGDQPAAAGDPTPRA